MAPKQKSQKKPFGIRKQWKLLAEYALARDGKPENMSCSDTLYEDGPTVGNFLVNHYVSRCIAPALKAAAAQAEKAAAADPSPVDPTATPATEKSQVVAEPVPTEPVAVPVAPATTEPEPEIVQEVFESPRPPTPDSMMSPPPSPKPAPVTATKRVPVSQDITKKLRPLKKKKVVDPKSSITLSTE